MDKGESGSQDSLDSWEQVEIPSKEEEELEKHSLNISNVEEVTPSVVEVGVESSQLSTSEASVSTSDKDNEK